MGRRNLDRVMLRFLVSLLVIRCGFTLISPSDSSLPSVALAAPVAQNPYPECPPNTDSIWIQVNNNDFGTDETLQIPFETGEVVGPDGHIYVNYLLGVLLAEASPDIDFNPVDDEFLKAMAILIRTVAYSNCGCEILAANPGCVKLYEGHRGMDDDIKQVYDPTLRNRWLANPMLGQAELDRYQRAIDDTAGCI